MGLYVPEEYGGQGLTQTGYCRVSEVFAQVDPVLSVIMGVHQSIGMKGIVIFGSDEQKARFLPDLASGRKLAGFALTEPEAGSDVHGMHTRAERESDGSWRLNGMKHYIGNGEKGETFVTFAATEHDGERRHTAFILEKGMKGFEVGKRFDTMGLRGNDLRELHFNDLRVPAENVLGEPGDGFKIAMHILNNGRMSLGTGSVGGAKFLLDRTIEHVKERKQFGQPIARLRAGAGQDRLDGLLPLRDRVDGLPHLRPRGPRRARLLARVGHGEGVQHRVPVVRGQPLPPAQGRRGLHARPALREDAARHADLPDLRGLQRRDARLRRPLGHEAGGRAPEGAGRREPGRSHRLDRRPGRLRGGPCPARGAPRPDHEGPRGPRFPRLARSPTRSSAWPPPRSRCCASTRARSPSASSTRSACPTPWRTSTRRSPCSRG